MFRARSIVASVLLSMSFTACADDGSSGDAPSGSGARPITGVTWILDEASIEGLIGRAVPDALVTIHFDEDGGAAGSTGCNRFNGTYTAGSDGALSVDPGGMIMMACEKPLMQIGAAYTAALTDVGSFEIVDGGAGLVLAGAAATLSYAAEQQLPLEGTSWVVDGIAIGDESVSSTIAGAEADLLFDAGNVSGSTGCNRVMGSYAVGGGEGGGSISFSDVATTKKLCEPDVVEQQTVILSALGAAASYAIDGSTLAVYGANGSYLLSLVGSP